LLLDVGLDLGPMIVADGSKSNLAAECSGQPGFSQGVLQTTLHSSHKKDRRDIGSNAEGELDQMGRPGLLEFAQTVRLPGGVQGLPKGGGR
jgi:hypothetical protein